MEWVALRPDHRDRKKLARISITFDDALARPFLGLRCSALGHDRAILAGADPLRAAIRTHQLSGVDYLAQCRESLQPR